MCDISNIHLQGYTMAAPGNAQARAINADRANLPGQQADILVGDAPEPNVPGQYQGAPRTTLDQRIAAITEVTGGTAPTVTISPSDADIEILKKRGDLALQVRFDDWLARKYRLNEPEANPYFFNMVRKEYPEFFERREAFVKDQEDIRQRASKIKIYGPGSMEDLRYEFLKHEDANFRGLVERATQGLYTDATTDAGARAEMTKANSPWSQSYARMKMYFSAMGGQEPLAMIGGVADEPIYRR